MYDHYTISHQYLANTPMDLMPTRHVPAQSYMYGIGFYTQKGLGEAFCGLGVNVVCCWLGPGERDPDGPGAPRVRPHAHQPSVGGPVQAAGDRPGAGQQPPRHVL